MASEEDLLKCARIVADRCIGYRHGENVLIVSDSAQSNRLNTALLTAFTELGADCEIVVLKPREYPGQEPPEPVAELMKLVDIVISIPIGSITYSDAVQKARWSGTRLLIATGISEDQFCRLIPVDYEEVAERARNAAGCLDSSRTARITSHLGTDVTVKLRGFGSLCIDGRVSRLAEMDYLPAGTAHTCPVEGTAEGTIVVDGSLVPLGILKDPVTMKVKNGKVTSIEGKEEADRYKQFLAGFYDPNVYNFAEIGLGLNPNAVLAGIAIIDERVQGSAFVGIGRSLQIGGRVNAKTHTDGVIRKPTLVLDEQTIIENGRLLIK